MGAQLRLPHSRCGRRPERNQVALKSLSGGFKGRFVMIKLSFAAAILLAAMLSSCANTAKGMATDAKQTGQAMDSSAHRVLKAGAAGNKAAQ